MLWLKRAYDPPSEDDGFRILVDGIWPSGMKRERIQIDLWLKDVAPSDELRRWFGHDPGRWGEFKERYYGELASKGDLIALISEKISSGDVTPRLWSQGREVQQCSGAEGISPPR